MSTPENPSSSQPVGHARPAAAADATQAANASPFDEQLQQFWVKSGKTVIAVCVVILLAILAKGGWEYMAASKEADLTKEYAAATTSEKLKTFAAAHPGHVLAGIAYLRLADEAYAAGKGADAVTNYEAAVKNLTGSPFLNRAELGQAMAKLQAGQTADAEAALKQIADRATEAKAVRLEAAYHLASLAQAAGRAEDAKKYTDQIIQIDASSSWAQRAMMLAAQSAPAVSATPAASVAPAADAAAAEPAIKLNVPAGK